MLFASGIKYAKIDEKDRFLFPVVLYNQIESEDGDVKLYLRRSADRKGFQLFPYSEFKRLTDNVKALFDPIIDKTELDAFYRQISTVVLDPQRRFKVPKELRADFDKEVVIVPTGDYFGLWSKEMYEEQNDAAEKSFEEKYAERLKERAEQMKRESKENK